MKDDLEGRIVGFTLPYTLDPSQVVPGDPSDAERTVWVRITDDEGDHLWGRSLHTDEAIDLTRATIHTIMPQGYPHSNR